MKHTNVCKRYNLSKKLSGLFDKLVEVTNSNYSKLNKGIYP